MPRGGFRHFAQSYKQQGALLSCRAPGHGALASTAMRRPQAAEVGQKRRTRGWAASGRRFPLAAASLRAREGGANGITVFFVFVFVVIVVVAAAHLLAVVDGAPHHVAGGLRPKKGEDLYVCMYVL